MRSHWWIDLLVLLGFMALFVVVAIVVLRRKSLKGL